MSGKLKSAEETFKEMAGKAIIENMRKEKEFLDYILKDEKK